MNLKDNPLLTDTDRAMWEFIPAERFDLRKWFTEFLKRWRRR